MRHIGFDSSSQAQTGVVGCRIIAIRSNEIDELDEVLNVFRVNETAKLIPAQLLLLLVLCTDPFIISLRSINQDNQTDAANTSEISFVMWWNVLANFLPLQLLLLLLLLSTSLAMCTSRWGLKDSPRRVISASEKRHRHAIHQLERRKNEKFCAEQATRIPPGSFIKLCENMNRTQFDPQGSIV